MGHGFESYSSLNFFRLSFRNGFTAMINPLFTLSSAVQMYKFSYIHFQETTIKQTNLPRLKVSFLICMCFSLLNGTFNSKQSVIKKERILFVIINMFIL